jgi:hypothetical protein
MSREKPRRIGDAQGKLVEVVTGRENYILKEIGRKQLVEVSRSDTLGKRAVVGDAEKAATADDGERLFVLYLDWHREAVKSGVAAILHGLARLGRSEERLAAVGLAKVRVRGGSLERVTDRVVV